MNNESEKLTFGSPAYLLGLHPKVSAVFSRLKITHVYEIYEKNIREGHGRTAWYKRELTKKGLSSDAYKSLRERLLLKGFPDLNDSVDVVKRNKETFQKLMEAKQEVPK